MPVFLKYCMLIFDTVLDFYGATGRKESLDILFTLFEYCQCSLNPSINKLVKLNHDKWLNYLSPWCSARLSVFERLCLLLLLFRHSAMSSIVPGHFT